MAVAFGSGGTYLTYGTHTNSTLVAPAGIADGDLLIAYLAVGSGSTPTTPTPPAGWSTLTGSPTLVNQTAGFFIKYNIFYKIAASESGNYTFTHAAYTTCGVVARYTGVDTATPFSPTPTTNTGDSTVNNLATATGFTTTVANTFIIFTEHDWGDTVTDTVVPTGTTPTFTERLDAVLLYIADGTLATAGATGNKSHACNNNSSSTSPWAAYLIGLNPATGGGGAPVTLTANPGSYTLTGTSAALGRQIINIGAAINDGTGDPVRVAFDKCNRNFADLYIADTTFLTTTAAAATYQPLDGDLTSLAAASATGAIYYRSAANTWAGVTIGTGLSFTGGTLANTIAAGGNVSNSGAPTAGQVAEWVTATTIAGVSTYAKLASPTFTGTPTLPTGTIGVTQTAGNSSTAVATTAFVTSANATKIGRTAIVGFGTSGTWTKNANLIGIIVEVWGGGGAGAVAVTGFGGSGGGYARKWYLASALGSTVTVTIGAGGTAAGNGGTTTFAAASSVQASGGSGAAATAGFGTGGDINLQGGNSNNGVSGATVGPGGNAPFMSGAAIAGSGANSGTPGSGGGGSSSGGNGAAGLCIVTEYYSV